MAAVLGGAPEVLTDVPLAVDPAEILRFQGYARGLEPPAAVRALLDEALALGERLMQPRVILRWARVTRQQGDALEAGGVVLTIPGIEGEWGRVEHLAAAVCTIGDALEEHVRGLWSTRDLPLAAMLDSVGSGAVERLAEHVSDRLCRQATASGLKATSRVSPGYRDWDVGDQPKLFALVPGETIGVALNDACFMQPAKSLSLLVGAGREAHVEHAASQCTRCWMAGCAYRRAPMRTPVRR